MYSRQYILISKITELKMPYIHQTETGTKTWEISIEINDKYNERIQKPNESNNNKCKRYYTTVTY